MRDRGAGLAETVRGGHQGDFGKAALPERIEQVRRHDPVRGQRVEHPWSYRHGHLLGAGVRDDRRLQLVGDRARYQAFAGGGGAKDDVHLVRFDEAAYLLPRLRGIAFRVVQHQLDLTAADAARAIDLVDLELESLLLGHAEDATRARERIGGADLQHLLRGRWQDCRNESSGSACAEQSEQEAARREGELTHVKLRANWFRPNE